MTPTLESERLILRGWEKNDFDAYAAFWADEEKTRHFLSGSLNRAQSWLTFCALAGEWTVNGLGCFAVVRKDTNTLAGHAGLWFPIYVEEPELMWSLYSGNEGQGFATEAARTVQKWAHAELGLPPLMSFVHPDNRASIAVAERLGAVRETETTLGGHPRLTFRHKIPSN